MKLLITIAAVLISISAFSQDLIEYDNGTFTQNGEELSMEQVKDLTVLHKAGRGNVRRGNRFNEMRNDIVLRSENNIVNLLGGAGGAFVGGLSVITGSLLTTGGFYIESVPLIGVPMTAAGTGLCIISYRAFSRITASKNGCLRIRDKQFTKVADKLNKIGIDPLHSGIGLEVPISSFTIPKNEVFVYLGWTQGYNYAGAPFNAAWILQNQQNDWLEVAAHYPIAGGLNINAGASVNLNFKSFEDLGLVYNGGTDLIDSDGNLVFGEGLYRGEYQARGTVINAGISYTLSSKLLQVIPGFGYSIGQEWEVLTWDHPGLDSFVNEYSLGTFFNPYFSLDVAYRNVLIGAQINSNYKSNMLPLTLRIGYGFPLKNKTRM
jgi:hypothetical protein